MPAIQNKQDEIDNLIEMEADELILIGAVVLVVSSLISAFALTNNYVTRSAQSSEKIVIGSGIGGMGNVIQALGRQKLYSIAPSLAREKTIIGDWTRAASNAANVLFVQEGILLNRYTFTDQGSRRDRAAMGEIPREEAGGQSSAEEQGVDEELKSVISGEAFANAIQGAGAFLSVEGISEFPPYPIQADEVLAVSLVGIGAFIKAYGSLLSLENEELQGTLKQVIGSWVQAGGYLIELNALLTKRAARQITKKEYTYGQYRHH